MAKDFMAKKSNSHMNGFDMMHIQNGHKNLGKAPMSSGPDANMMNKKKMKSQKMKKSSKSDFDMDDME